MRLLMGCLWIRGTVQFSYLAVMRLNDRSTTSMSGTGWVEARCMSSWHRLMLLCVYCVASSSAFHHGPLLPARLDLLTRVHGRRPATSRAETARCLRKASECERSQQRQFILPELWTNGHSTSPSLLQSAGQSAVRLFCSPRTSIDLLHSCRNATSLNCETRWDCERDSPYKDFQSL